MAGKHEYIYSKVLLPGLKRIKIDTAASGNTTIVAAVTSRIIRVYSVTLISAGSVIVKFQDGTGGTDLTGPLTLSTSTGFAPGWNPVGHFQTSSGTLLNINLSAAIQVGGWLIYGEIK